MITVTPADFAQAEYIAAYMRRDDAAECAALGMTPREAIMHSLQSSLVARCALDGDTPVAMWGVTPYCALLGDIGLCWMLTTPDARRHPRDILSRSRAFRDDCQSIYSTLVCVVDLQYYQAVRWVEWLGFRRKGIVPAKTATSLGLYVLQ